jgi:hypothetical protein
MEFAMPPPWCWVRAAASVKWVFMRSAGGLGLVSKDGVADG